MSETGSVSPLLDNWVTEKLISRSESTRVYEIRGKHGSERRCVLKHISIPAGDTQVRALIYSGCVSSEAEAHEYYTRVLEDLEQELAGMKKLAHCPNFLGYEDYQAIPREDGPGYEVYLIMEQRETLRDVTAEGKMSRLRAVNLGIDVCSALTELRKAGFLHRSVRPENIFLNDYGQYMLGDLGLSRLDSLTGSHMPENELSEFSAPEVNDAMNELNPTIDIYSLGMVLYRIYNGGHNAFEDEKTSPSEAEAMRLAGEEMPAPMYADYELASIILKACAPEPEDRYQSPEEMHKALSDYMFRNRPSDEPVVPPIILDPDPDFKGGTVPSPADLIEEEYEPLRMSDISSLDDDFIESFTPGVSSPESSGMGEEDIRLASGGAEDGGGAYKSGKKKKKSRVLPAVIILLFCLAGAAAAAWFFWPTVEISNLTATATGSGSVELQWDNYGYQSGGWTVVCLDSYGSRTELTTERTHCSFSGLNPGSEYSFTVAPAEDYARFEGDSIVSAVTTSRTDISSFTATALSSGEVGLSWQVSGTDPGYWTVTCSSPGWETIVQRFEGNSGTVTGLVGGKSYTFTLSTDIETELHGTTSVLCTTMDYTRIDSFTATATAPDTLLVSWEFTGTDPKVWILTRTNPDGTQESMNVAGTSAQISGLGRDSSYEFTLSSEEYELIGETQTRGLSSHSSVGGVQAAATGPDSIEVSWELSGMAPEQWTVTLSGGWPSGSSSVVTTSGTSAVFTGLYPSTEYSVSVAAPGFADNSESVTVRTDDAEAFTGYGISSAALVLFLEPNIENWGDGNLTERRTYFSVNESIAFSVNASYAISDSDKSVETMYIVRSTDSGQISAVYTGSRSWNGNWRIINHTGSLDETPQTPGNYVLEIYFDGGLLASAAFSVG